MNQILDLIKQNKKIVIILIVVLVAFLILTLLGKGNDNGGDYFATLTNLANEESYNGTVDLNVGGKDIQLTVLKNNQNFVISANIPSANISYNDLIVKQDGVLYLNSGSVTPNGGLIAVRDVPVDKKAQKLSDILLSSLKDAEFTVSSDENGATISIGNTDEWALFFSTVSTALSENSDSVSQQFKETEAVKGVLNELAKITKSTSETDTVANTITSTLKVEDVESARTYTGTFEFTSDFAALPDFINAEDFDSNQLKITGSINITTGVASTAKPTGAVYDANAQSIQNFFLTLWNDIFQKEEFVALNEVTITSNSVHNKYDLGEIIEESNFSFNKDGIYAAEWIIYSTNKLMIEAYKNKYAAEVQIEENEDTGIFTLHIPVSENGLLTLNKISTNPEKFGEYLKTSKGGDIIV